MDHKELDAWKVAMDLAQGVYHLTSRLPREEKWGLSAQMRRAAVSVPSNLSEGAARDSNRDFARFLSIGLGSLAELETQLELAKKLGYLQDVALKGLIERERALIIGLRNHLRH